MGENKPGLADQYIIALRIVQPARIQEIVAACGSIWAYEPSASDRSILSRVHEQMRDQGRLIAVRRGTYVLSADGMRVAARLLKERKMDNARMFLMKEQRKAYHRFRAGRIG